MDEDFLWAILGLALVIVELLTGTFYLLMLGIAAFGAALAAWLGPGVRRAGVVVAAVIAAAGCYGVHVYRAKNAAQQMPPIDAGQPASFESWVDQGARLARVRYRGASLGCARGWRGGARSPARMLYVLATDGNTLKVTSPSRIVRRLPPCAGAGGSHQRGGMSMLVQTDRRHRPGRRSRARSRDTPRLRGLGVLHRGGGGVRDRGRARRAAAERLGGRAPRAASTPCSSRA